MRLRRHPSAVPISDLPTLQTAARRTRLVRIAVAVGLVALLAAAVVTGGVLLVVGLTSSSASRRTATVALGPGSLQLRGAF